MRILALMILGLMVVGCEKAKLEQNDTGWREDEFERLDQLFHDFNGSQ